MKRLVLMLSVTLTAFLAPLSIGAGGTVTYTATYDGTPVLGTDTLGGVTYTTVRLPGLSNLGEPGTPSLPVDYISFSVPYNATNIRVTCASSERGVLPLEHPVYPCQAFQGGQVIVTPPSSTCYSGGQYPPQLAWFSDESMVAGENHIVTVAVMPVACKHSTGDTLRLMESVRVTLTYDQGTPFITPMVRSGASLRAKGHELAESMVVNPDDVRGNAVPAASRPMFMHIGYPVPDENVTDPDTYIIVTTPELRRSMRRLAALRMQKGMRVKVITANEAINDSAASDGDYIFRGGEYILVNTDDAGKLRQYLRHHFLHRGTEYALIAGSDVPYMYHNDMYYCDFNADWISFSDKDSEIYSSRLLGSDTKQFDNYTDKLLRYELNPGNGDFSYLNRNIFVEGTGHSSFLGIDATPGSDDVMINEETVDHVTGNDILDLVSVNHYGLMSTFCEGTRSHIKVFDDGNGDSHYIWAIDTVKASNITDSETGNGLNRMLNRDYPMLYFAPFGATMSHSTPPGDVAVNYGESFTMGRDYGGPAYIGLNSEQYHMLAFNLACKFWSALGNGVTEMGKVRAQVMSGCGGYNEPLLTACNMLGDPALDKWTGTPMQYSGVTVTRTDNAVTISGITPSSTIIGYHSNDGVTGSCLTSGQTTTLTGVSPNSTIMLYKHNSIPYIAPLVLQNTTLRNSQYVIATDVTAGCAVDSQRTQGDVVVEGGVEYEIEASGQVRLEAGFKVEQGATFAVRPATYK